jgi:hypothetical protein
VSVIVDNPGALAALERLHAEIDRAADALADRHGDRLNCALGCSGCCVDGISVFQIEAERIRRRADALLANGQPREAGACAFLDDSGGCRIYEFRPYVCRTQGLPLRWTERRGDAVVELRDICPLNEEGAPVETLEPNACWEVGPFEARLAEIDRRWSGGAPRIQLRSLFHRAQDGPTDRSGPERAAGQEPDRAEVPGSDGRTDRAGERYG